MNISFEKYQGAGNDFILVDIREQVFREDPAVVRLMCDRRFGAGADGMILVGPDSEAAFSMRYFNADGRESTMCGNGGRCVAWYALRHGLAGENMIFSAIDGLHHAAVLSVSGESAAVKLRLNDVTGIEKGPDHYTLDTGSPHYVCFHPDVSGLDVRKLGASVRYSDPYRDTGINVNFAAWSGGTLLVRTYERGVEDETLSCGTGVTATALVVAMNDPALPSPVSVRTTGGRLQVHFVRMGGGFRDIWLEGPATRVFTGTMVIPE